MPAHERQFVIWAQYHPASRRWSGACVELGKNGTHKHYNMLYNGKCESEYFDTEGGAKKEAQEYIYKAET